jgi:hypothetical protein
VAREGSRAKLKWLTDKGWEATRRMALMGRIAAGRGSRSFVAFFRGVHPPRKNAAGGGA